MEISIFLQIQYKCEHAFSWLSSADSLHFPDPDKWLVLAGFREGMLPSFVDTLLRGAKQQQNACTRKILLFSLELFQDRPYGNVNACSQVSEKRDVLETFCGKQRWRRLTLLLLPFQASESRRWRWRRAASRLHRGPRLRNSRHKMRVK